MKIFFITTTIVLSFIHFNKENQPILGNEEKVFLGSSNGLVYSAKVDSGAETTSLHAKDIHTYEKIQLSKNGNNKLLFVRFKTTDDNGKEQIIEKTVSRQSVVRSASGSKMRIFIKERIWIGGKSFKVEINLADRSNLSKKMLIGKNIIQLGYLIDAKKSFLVSYR
jgi:hypothetical protein